MSLSDCIPNITDTLHIQVKLSKKEALEKKKAEKAEAAKAAKEAQEQAHDRTHVYVYVFAYSGVDRPMQYNIICGCGVDRHSIRSTN